MDLNRATRGLFQVPASHDSYQATRIFNPKENAYKFELDHLSADPNALESNLEHAKLGIAAWVKKKFPDTKINWELIPFHWVPPKSKIREPLADTTLGIPSSISEFASWSVRYTRSPVSDLKRIIVSQADFNAIEKACPVSETETETFTKVQGKFDVKAEAQSTGVETPITSTEDDFTIISDKGFKTAEHIKNYKFMNLFRPTSDSKFEILLSANSATNQVSMGSAKILQLKDKICEAAEKFTSYYGFSGSLREFFDYKVQDQYKEILKHIIFQLQCILPSQIKMSFLRGAISSFEKIKISLLDLTDNLKREPNILKLRALIKSLPEFYSRDFNLRTLVMAFRDVLFEYFRTWSSPIELSEHRGESENFEGPDEYGPIMNFVIILMISASDKTSRWENLIKDLAIRQSIDPDQVHYGHLLQEKEYFYSRSQGQRTTRNFKLELWERAFDACPEDPTSTYFKLWETLTSREAFITSKVKSGEKKQADALCLVEDKNGPESELFMKIFTEDGTGQNGAYFEFNRFADKIKSYSKAKIGKGQGVRRTFDGPYVRNGFDNEGKPRFKPVFNRQNFNRQKFSSRESKPNYRSRDKNPKRKEYQKKLQKYKKWSTDKFRNLSEQERVEMLNTFSEAIGEPDSVLSSEEEEPRTTEEINHMSNSIAEYVVVGENQAADSFVNFDESIYSLVHLLKNETVSTRKYRTGTIFECSDGSKLTVIYDSGATSSYCHIDALRKIGNFTKIPVKGPQQGFAAGGVKLNFLNFRANFNLICNSGFKFKVESAAVTDTGPWDLMLLGVRDLQENHTDMEFRPGGKTTVKIKGFETRQFDSLRLFEYCSMFDRINSLDKENSSKTSLVSSNFSNVKVNTKEMIWKDPDSWSTFKSKIEKLAREARNSNSMNEVEIDPKNEVLPDLNNPEEARSKIVSILNKHKVLFNGDIGTVTDDRYVVRGRIDIPIGTKRAPNYYSSMAPNVLEALTSKLDNEIANDVLIKLPRGMPVKNIINVFAVPKKDKFGNVVLNMTHCRIVVDCSRTVNGNTEFRGTQSDNINEIVQTVCPYTTKGFITILDISQMFFCFRLDRDLWPYFVVEHPEMGLFCYKRMPQGWIVCPSVAREFMLQILYKFKTYLRRYLDDIVLFSNSFDDHLDLLDKVLNTLKVMGFRMKGSKMQVLGKTIALLGKTLTLGKILASSHTIENLNNFTVEVLKTKKNLKSFLGIASYLADHVPYASEVLAPLRKEAAGVNALEVKWSEPLKKALTEALRICNKAIQLWPVDPDSIVYGVFDSSYTANAGFFYQLGPKGEKRFIKIFSRRRSDADNKFKPSSCLVELTGIAAAMLHAKAELELVNKEIILFTDSKSAADLYKKLRTAAYPSEDKKINEVFLKLMCFNYKLEYMRSEELPLTFADFLSRQKAASEPCTDKDCKVCEAVNTSIDFKNDPGADDRLYTLINCISREMSRFRFIDEPEPTILLDHFLLLQEDVYPEVLNEEPGMCYPWGTDEWFNSLAPMTQFPELKNFNHSTCFAVQTRMGPRFHSSGHNFKSIRLSHILDDPKILRIWQAQDKTIKKALEILNSGTDIPNKFPRVTTLLIKEECFMDQNGLLVKPTKAFKVAKITQVIKIPAAMTIMVVHAVHNSRGHMSISAMENEVKRHFDCPGLKEVVAGVISKCRDCTLRRLNPTVVKRMRNFDKETLEITRIGQKVLADEMHRTINTSRRGINNSGIKILFASEYLSRYSYAEVIPSENSEDLKLALINVKDTLAVTEQESTDITVRMDRVASHVSLSKDLDLKQEGIKLELREKVTMSKNDLAPLDGRMSKFSRMLNYRLGDARISPEQAVKKAVRDYNFTISAEGYRPVELFHGRLVNGEQFEVPLENLKNTQIGKREAIRNSIMKNKELRFKTRPINFVPFSEKNNSYINRKAMPIKCGDILLIDAGGFQKNDLRPFFQIVSTDRFPQGINWDERQVHCKKMDLVNSTKRIYIFDFDYIRHVIDGEVGLNLDDLEKDLKAERIFYSWESYGPVLDKLEEFDYMMATNF